MMARDNQQMCVSPVAIREGANVLQSTPPDVSRRQVSITCSFPRARGWFWVDCCTANHCVLASRTCTPKVLS